MQNSQGRIISKQQRLTYEEIDHPEVIPSLDHLMKIEVEAAKPGIESFIMTLYDS